ncbi:hypothetical protein ACA910_001283 [Epithemia clementina (nom. ined.)]
MMAEAETESFRSSTLSNKRDVDARLIETVVLEEQEVEKEYGGEKWDEERDDDSEKRYQGQTLDPISSILPTSLLPQATEHEQEAKALLEQVLEQAAAGGLEEVSRQHHRRKTSRLPTSHRLMPFLPDLLDSSSTIYAPTSHQDQHEGTPSSREAPHTEEKKIGGSAFAFTGGAISLAESTQYVMALHQDYYRNVKSSEARQASSSTSSSLNTKNHTIPELSAVVAPLAAAPLSATTTGDGGGDMEHFYFDNSGEPVSVDHVHPADRVYAAATVLKAAARFSMGRGTKPISNRSSSDSPPNPPSLGGADAAAGYPRRHSAGGTTTTPTTMEDKKHDDAILTGNSTVSLLYRRDESDVEGGTPTTAGAYNLHQAGGDEDDMTDTQSQPLPGESHNYDWHSPPGGGGDFGGPPHNPYHHPHQSSHKEKQNNKENNKRNQRKSRFKLALMAAKQEWHSLSEFFQPKHQSMKDQLLFVCWAVVVPCIVAAVVLFYFVENPSTGRCNDQDPCGRNSNGAPVASVSWWILFLGVRQVVTWLLARFSDAFFFDWLVLQHRRVIRLLGSRISLIVIQSKGWPSVTLWWAVWNFMILQGNGRFNHHWLYWQRTITLFTAANPSGDIPSSERYRAVLMTMIFVAFSVSVKRYILALHLGRRLYLRFNERLAEMMTEIGLISELALWARKKRDKRATYAVWLKMTQAHHRPPPRSLKHGSNLQPTWKGRAGRQRRNTLRDSSVGPTRGVYGTQASRATSDATIDYDKVLEQWTEPKRGKGEKIHASKIIEFRQAFAVMTKPFFFSSAFGPLESRKECIASADRLFRRLLKLFDEMDETIDVNDLVRWMYKGCELPGQKEKSDHLILLSNPDADNRLNIEDFVKGIDAIYQRVRLLENAVHNASHIDREYEKILNYLFYFLVACVALAILQLDPLTLLLTVSGLLVAISFMIGPGSAVFFEGIMMILGRQPYDVGDRIAIGNVSDMPDFDGSTQWIVENVDLLSTTARLVYTNEVANFSNGSLARSRLINMNRSPDPVIYVYVRFQTDVPYSTITIFRSALEIFVEGRPQEWQGLLGFRTSRVEAQLNFVEYIVILQHRLTWQSLIPIKESRAAVASFCVEIQKQLGCHYCAPPMPVEITMKAPSSSGIPRMDSSMDDLMETAKQFGARKED